MQVFLLLMMITASFIGQKDDMPLMHINMMESSLQLIKMPE